MMRREEALILARLALKGIGKQYPNKPGDVLNSEKDIQETRAIHPAFYGSFDWHSSVHGHWMLVRLLRLFPDLPEKQEIRVVLGRALERQEPAGRGCLLYPPKLISPSSGPTAGRGC